MKNKLFCTLFLVAFLAAFSQKDFYKKDYPDLIEKKRDIQHFDSYNQDNVDMLSNDGGFLMVKKDDYDAVSTGFRLAKFRSDGNSDTKFLTEADMPQARYLASDIAQAENGDIYVAGLRKREGESDFDAKCIIVKYAANGKRDKTFGIEEEGCFSIDLHALWGWTGPKILLANDGLLLQAHTVFGMGMEARISVVKISNDGKYFVPGYFAPSRSSGRECAWDVAGSYICDSAKLLSDGRMILAGVCEDNGIPGFRSKGFLAVFGKGLKLDKTFGANGILYMDASSSKLSSLDDVVELSGGKLLVLGTLRNDKAANGKYEARIFMSRLFPDGRIDKAFASNGFSIFDEGQDDFGQKILALKDGDIAVAFHSADDDSRRFTHKFFAIFDSNGKESQQQKLDFSVYQQYVVWNFPYKSILQKMAHDYDR